VFTVGNGARTESAGDLDRLERSKPGIVERVAARKPPLS